jgi:hypothetical protein
VYHYIDTDTNILLNKYGAHLFHTNNDRVWEYINRFDTWVRWDHQVLGQIGNKLVNIPVNINTVNALCSEHLKNETEMNEWLNTNQVKYDVIDNSEKMGKSRVGNILYDKIFKDYTFKQWVKYPEELDASVLARQPDNIISDWFNMGSNVIMNCFSSIFLQLEYINLYTFYKKEQRDQTNICYDNTECIYGPEHIIRDYMNLMQIPKKSINSNLRLF